MNLKDTIGYDPEKSPSEMSNIVEYINLKLAAMGCPFFGRYEDFPMLNIAKSLLATYRERGRFLQHFLCSADMRIQLFLDDYLKDSGEQVARMMGRHFVLDKHGIARALSLAPDADVFHSKIISSYRLKNGIVHNPINDRRTTKGVFHVTEGGLPIPDDKLAVPKKVFARLWAAALNPPGELLELPFTSTQEERAQCFVSLLLRPVICPKVPGVVEEKSMEVRFFAPGNLVSNLDFVESIFGNAGDPYQVENDSALDAEHWSGHTGCVILAPHLVNMTKKELGLPHISEASERQKRDRMCWEHEDECYNDGSAFKITARDGRGVIVTLIADNYFGYCKKEVKTQISYACNLYGLTEEEHAGGALVFPSYDLGESYTMSPNELAQGYSFEEMISKHGDFMNVQPEGYAIDKMHPEIIYLRENVLIEIDTQRISWLYKNKEHKIKLLPDHLYILPSGYLINMVKPGANRRWRLQGTRADPTFCHKPCTVSGGGKSEISKSLTDAIIEGPMFVNDFEKDMEMVDEILRKDYSKRFLDPAKKDERSLLSENRSLGSVVKMLTPSKVDFTEEYNAWLRNIPQVIKELVLIVKRFYKPDWGMNWRSRFSVDNVDGVPGRALRYRNQKITPLYLRVGFDNNGSWRTFGLRKDFLPAAKIAEEDDITASVVVSSGKLVGLDPSVKNASLKFTANCEYRLFQRPDDAIIRGYDKVTEMEMSGNDLFLSNYEPLTRAQVKEIVEDTIRFEQYTKPIQDMLLEFLAEDTPEFICLPSHPRLVDGKPSKNPRYLQMRPDLTDTTARYCAGMMTRLCRNIEKEEVPLFPVSCILPGRRQNPPEKGIRPLATFNPVHYMELPELFMEVTASLTGKSPSTTGAGSEGALTKGPFNALLPIHDLNNAFVSFALCGYGVFVTAAGHIGPNFRVDHDISLLVPEVWSRMKPHERQAEFLIKEGYLERCEDIEFNGETVESSRMGWRITEHFVHDVFGRVFNNPNAVFTPEMLRPELQSMEVFADGMKNIVEAHKRVAESYFHDGSIERACPPLKALLNIMAYGHYEGKTIKDAEVRSLFTRDAVINSEWYKERLKNRQKIELNQVQKSMEYMNAFLGNTLFANHVYIGTVRKNVRNLEKRLQRLADPLYWNELNGTIGADSIH